jgi:hypothetical protein
VFSPNGDDYAYPYRTEGGSFIASSGNAPLGPFDIDAFSSAAVGFGPDGKGLVYVRKRDGVFHASESGIVDGPFDNVRVFYGSVAAKMGYIGKVGGEFTVYANGSSYGPYASVEKARFLPDGSGISFVYTEKGPTGLVFGAFLNGAVLSPYVKTQEPRYSESGSHSFLVGLEKCAGGLRYVVNIDGERKFETETALSVGQPLWSPAEDRMAFLVQDSGDKKYRIHCGESILGPFADLPYGMCWRKGDDLPTFSLPSGAGWTLYAGTEKLLDSPMRIFDASWSPDGKRLAYLTDGKTGMDVMVDGKKLGSYAQVNFIGWSPDSKTFAYYEERAGRTIHVGAASFGGFANAYSSSWSKDGRALAFGTVVENGAAYTKVIIGGKMYTGNISAPGIEPQVIGYFDKGELRTIVVK